MIPWYGLVVIATGCALPIVFALLAPTLYGNDPLPLMETDMDEQQQRQPSDRALAVARDLAGAHRVVEDCWYSCPMSGECCNDGAGSECNCGLESRVIKIAYALDEFYRQGKEER